MAVAARDSGRPWEPFGVTEADFAAAPERHGVRVVNVTPGGRGPDRAERWLRGAAAVLGLLAVAAAAVSWQAQYVMVLRVKHAVAVAAIEAAIPDAGAVVFAALGVALALHGKRALRPRALNAACIGISLAMNALAAGHGWRDLVIWMMPAGVYALASDTLIGVVRAWVLARARNLGETLADDGPTPLALVGALALWLLRLALAPASTLSGFRGWVVRDCPAAPGLRPGHLAELTAVRQEAEERIALAVRRHDEAVERADAVAARAQAAETAVRTKLDRARADADSLRDERDRLATQLRAAARRARAGGAAPAQARRARGTSSGDPTKRDRMITLAAGRHDLAALPLDQVSGVANELAAEIGYSPGTARRELLNHVRQLRAAPGAGAPAMHETDGTEGVRGGG
jgi:hypothetical protein